MHRRRLFVVLAALFLVGAPFSLARGIQDGRRYAVVTGICGLALTWTSVMQVRDAEPRAVRSWWPPAAILLLSATVGVALGVASRAVDISGDRVLIAAVVVGIAAATGLALYLRPQHLPD